MNLYLSNLAPGTSREEILKAFRAHGEVSSVSLPGDGMKDGGATGPNRGYGFVVMPDRVQARAACAALDHREIGGRALSVRVAVPGRHFRARR